jgi:hypothetical protein
VGLIKRALRALKKRAEDMAWSVIGGVVGGGIGLLFAAAYLRYR